LLSYTNVPPWKNTVHHGLISPKYYALWSGIENDMVTGFSKCPFIIQINNRYKMGKHSAHHEII